MHLQTVHNACINENLTLGIDKACLSVINLYNTTLQLYYITAECFRCSGLLKAILPPLHNTTLEIPTEFPLHLYYTEEYERCHTTYNFREYGNYGWNLSRELTCSDFYVLKQPPDPYLPCVIAVWIYILLAVIWKLSKVLYRIIKERISRFTTNFHDDLDRLQELESTSQPAIRTTRSSTRNRSVDTFRGIAILLMIFVDNGGGKYVFFRHSTWNGLTFADLVLPWFAWIMGMSISLSKRAELRVSNSRSKIILRNFQRSLTLILLGLILNSQHSKFLKDLRFTGVLQLLGITYFICATMETMFMKAHTQFGSFSIIRDVLDSWIQWCIIIVTVTIHTCITFLLPVPNCPKGYLGPGGYAQSGKYENCTGGAAGYIDRLIFGSHIYNTTKNPDPVYGPMLPHDPEGLMNVISALLIVYMGVQAGKILLLYYQYNHRVLRWLIWSAILGIIAGLLCNFEKEGGVIPVNKKMMSLSFLLTTSSFAFILFTILHLIIDHKQFWSGAPFTYAGLNPLVLYVGHSITRHLFPWSWALPEPTHTSVLALNLWTTTLWGLIGYVLYTKDIIITA